MTSFLKTAMFILVLTLTGWSAHAASCSISNFCGASCSITSPPGGTVNCFVDYDYVLCIAYDAHGNIAPSSYDYCPFGR